MIPPQYEKLLSKLELASNTIYGLWKKTSDRNKFSVRINTITILISIYTSYPEELDCTALDIMNTGGEIIDGIYLDPTEEGYSRLRTLYDAAKRNALKIPETLSDVENGLDYILSSHGINVKSDKEVDDLPF